MSKSNHDIASAITRRIELLVLTELPTPECASKRQHNEWRRDEVRQMIAAKLVPPGNGITINVTP